MIHLVQRKHVSQKQAALIKHIFIGQQVKVTLLIAAVFEGENDIYGFPTFCAAIVSAGQAHIAERLSRIPKIMLTQVCYYRGVASPRNKMKMMS